MSAHNPDFSTVNLSPANSASSRDLEAEMRRLKLELKQTMEMYSSACKEALNAKKMAKELRQWKLEEAKQAEEAALAVAKMEKVKCQAAIEVDEKVQMLAEIMKAQRRSRVSPRPFMALD